MKAIKTTELEGDVSVGRNLTTGGNVTVRGSGVIERDFEVKGWLKARNIKGACKGLFVTEARLNQSYPTPHNGWWAMVGNAIPAAIYRADAGAWVATGETGGNPVLEIENLSELESMVTSLQDFISIGLIDVNSVKMEYFTDKMTLNFNIKKLDNTYTPFSIVYPAASYETAGLMSSTDKTNIKNLLFSILKINRSNVVYLKDFITSNIQVLFGVVGDKWFLTDTKKIREVTKVDSIGIINDTIEYPPFPESIYLKEGVPDKIYLFSTENGMTPMSGGSGGLSLGETAGTAYEGSKGKANADAIAKINRSNTVYLQGNTTSDLLIAGGNLHDKWYLTDTKQIREITGVSEIGGVRTTDYVPYPDSIFIYKDNPNEIYTFSPEEGMRKNTLSLGETAGTAYEGSKGKANADAIAKINRSNTVYLQGNTTSDLLIAGGNLHDRWYLTDTKKIREIVGFTEPAKSPITEDYAPIDNSIYIYKNDPAKIYLFSTENGMYLASSNNEVEYLDDVSLQEIIGYLKDNTGAWKYNIKYPFATSNQFLGLFFGGVVEVIPLYDSDFADDVIKVTCTYKNNIFEFVALSDSNDFNDWKQWSLIYSPTPCGPISYTDFLDFKRQNDDGFDFFSLVTGTTWIYSPTKEEITEHNLSGSVFEKNCSIDVCFRANGDTKDWYTLKFYATDNYYNFIPDAISSKEDGDVVPQGAYHALFDSQGLEMANESNPDTLFIGLDTKDNVARKYNPKQIVKAGDAITPVFYTPVIVQDNNIAFSKEKNIFIVNVSSTSTFTITVDSTDYELPKKLVINQTLVSQIIFPDHIVWLETPDFSQPGVYHVEFKICVQDPTKLLALVTFKEPVVL
ncbi:hypothetical protein OCV73_02520 [Barnesiella propionica]|uniref:hypothetical protein n=1 Tax=Barnesiella propionica TaxID=2981781 RepID=UPI0011C95181|nr:hypothetical protein [Barnesiella propionica]MCU6767832.1 hypothetical protein [Barnesiella propionica]